LIIMGDDIANKDIHSLLVVELKKKISTNKRLTNIR